MTRTSARLMCRPMPAGLRARSRAVGSSPRPPSCKNDGPAGMSLNQRSPSDLVQPHKKIKTHTPPPQRRRTGKSPLPHTQAIAQMGLSELGGRVNTCHELNIPSRGRHAGSERGTRGVCFSRESLGCQLIDLLEQGKIWFHSRIPISDLGLSRHLAFPCEEQSASASRSKCKAISNLPVLILLNERAKFCSNRAGISARVHQCRQDKRRGGPPGSWWLRY